MVERQSVLSTKGVEVKGECRAKTALIGGLCSSGLPRKGTDKEVVASFGAQIWGEVCRRVLVVKAADD